jgi:hypothetical protein
VPDWIAAYMLLAAEAATTPTSEFTAWAQFGLVGVVAFGGIVFARGAYKRETDRSDRLEGELRELHKAIAEQHIPALQSSARATEAATELVRDMDDRLRRRGGSR